MRKLDRDRRVERVSELIECLAHKYNNMSKESKSETGLTYNPAYLGGYRQCVVDAQEYKPTLNENQQQVLGWLQLYYRPKDSIFYGIEQISDVYEDPESLDAFDSLTKKQEAQVIQSFISWVLEQEEE